jgi:hypothetical protein
MQPLRRALRSDTDKRRCPNCDRLTVAWHGAEHGACGTCIHKYWERGGRGERRGYFTRRRLPCGRMTRQITPKMWQNLGRDARGT